MSTLSTNQIKAFILNHAPKYHIKIATAESCTAGLLSAALTDLAGSSAYFDRSFITYSNSAKQEMLDVKAQTLETFGAVSQEIAQEMALGALTHSSAQLTLAITGIAGPGSSEHKPEGRVCFALATREICHSETQDFGPLGRDQVRRSATHYALNLIYRHISAISTTH